MENLFHNQFQIYNGPEPYIFVSYCHQDADMVLKILEGLVRSGCRIWFDGGIPWTDEWGVTIKDRIDHCAVFMGFHSGASALSEHCRLEIRYALDHRKPALSVYLEDVDLGYGLDERLARYDSARLSQYGDLRSLEGALMRKSVAVQCAVEPEVVGVPENARGPNEDPEASPDMEGRPDMGDSPDMGGSPALRDAS